MTRSDLISPIMKLIPYHTIINLSVTQILLNISSSGHIPITHIVLPISASSIMKRESSRVVSEFSFSYGSRVSQVCFDYEEIYLRGLVEIDMESVHDARVHGYM